MATAKKIPLSLAKKPKGIFAQHTQGSQGNLKELAKPCLILCWWPHLRFPSNPSQLKLRLKEAAEAYPCNNVLVSFFRFDYLYTIFPHITQHPYVCTHIYIYLKKYIVVSMFSSIPIPPPPLCNHILIYIYIYPYDDIGIS